MFDEARIAEFLGKRRYHNHFIGKLTVADSEHYEFKHWVRIFRGCGYLNGTQEKCRVSKTERYRPPLLLTVYFSLLTD